MQNVTVDSLVDQSVDRKFTQALFAWIVCAVKLGKKTATHGITG